MLFQPDPHCDEAIFREIFTRDYSAFKSIKYESLDWYVGINKFGHPKPANKTSLGQKSTKFLARGTKS